VPVDPDKIRNLRERLGLTQQQAAKNAGMKSKQHWNNIENGRQTSDSISVALLERIAVALKTTPANLLR
jgi:transcriptional regulator with XRE-family HTH domain